MSRNKYTDPVKDDISKLMAVIYQHNINDFEPKSVHYYLKKYNRLSDSQFDTFLEIYQNNNWISIDNKDLISIYDGVPYQNKKIVEEIYNTGAKVYNNKELQEYEDFYTLGDVDIDDIRPDNGTEPIGNDALDQLRIAASKNDNDLSGSTINENYHNTDIKFIEPITPQTYIIVQNGDITYSHSKTLDDDVKQLLNSEKEDIHIFKLHKSLSYKIEETNYGNSNKRQYFNIRKIFNKIYRFLVRSVQNV